MYLEKLEIQGFKSFANKNKLIFSGILEDQKRGITVVVGPNGSGKSNIADAIRWVLGEQSTKLLRSKKSEDVIFSGSDKKSRLNMAEVSLYLNNENGSLKFKDLNNEKKELDSLDALLGLSEIVVSRRIFRDGNSEYYINNNKVRLSDVQMFLAKVNFGQKTYSVIGQGMVENFLNTSPSERKAFFDEATGVKQYQIKRELSLNRLETSQENLSKVEMLLNEIEPRLRSLGRQVQRLKKRQGLEEELKKGQLKYYAKIWQDIDSQILKTKTEIDELKKEREVQDKFLEDSQQKVDEHNQAETIGEEFYKLQKKFLDLEAEKTKIQEYLEKINLLEKIKTDDFNTEDQELLLLLEQEKDELIKKIEIVSQELEAGGESFTDDKNLRQLEEDLSKLKSLRQEKYKDLSKIEAWIEVSLEKQGKFDLAFLNNQQSEISQDISDLRSELEILEEALIKKNSQVEDLRKKDEALRKDIKELENSLSVINIEESPTNTKKINQALSELIKLIENTKNINQLNEFREIVIKVENKLKELLDFSSGQTYQYRLESINKQLLELKNSREKSLLDLNQAQLEYQSESNYLEDLKNRLNRKNKDLIEVLGKIKLNQADNKIEENQTKKNEIEKELKEIDELLIQKEKSLVQVKSQEETWKNLRNERQEELQISQRNLNSVEEKINQIKIKSFKSQSRFDDLVLNLKTYSFAGRDNVFDEGKVKEEIDFVQNLFKENEAQSTILKEKIDNFNQAQEDKKQKLLSYQAQIKDLESKIRELDSKINDEQLNLARGETRIEELEKSIADDKLNLDQIKSFNISADDIIPSRDDISKIKSQLDLIGGIDPETEKEYQETKERYDFLFEQTTDLNKTIKSLEKIIIELDQIIKDQFNKEFKIISEKFNKYFKILFNGGQAKILTIKDDDSDDQSSDKKEEETADNLKIIKRLKKYNTVGFSGIDISATPPGKKISSVNMLSGGERALTAIALICAIISANPSPFVVLDEVDAALDEANSERLAQILDDLSNKTQFIVISHNRATMRKANILYGVTMQDDGVSKLLSVKLDDKIE